MNQLDKQLTMLYYWLMEPRVKFCELDTCRQRFETFDGRKRFCSRSCAATANNLRKGKTYRDCKTCGKDIVAWDSKVFCSDECRVVFPINEWKNGNWDGTVKDGLSATIRKYLLEQAKYKCQDGRSGCNGWGMVNPKNNRTCLTIDHIDGNVYNNRPENLIVICPNCHSMTPTYGALNKGNGRKYRYNRAVVTQLVE